MMSFVVIFIFLKVLFSKVSITLAFIFSLFILVDDLPVLFFRDTIFSWPLCSTEQPSWMVLYF